MSVSKAHTVRPEQMEPDEETAEQSDGEIDEPLICEDDPQIHLLLNRRSVSKELLEERFSRETVEEIYHLIRAK